MQDQNIKHLSELIRIAIEEDIAGGDLATQSIIPTSSRATAIMTAKAEGIISGIEVARQVIDTVGENTFIPLVKDGDHVQPRQELIRIEAAYDTLLCSERIMLNFLQRMSGIATATHELVQLLQGTSTQLLDTRKTLPGHRYTDKMAVRHGGGTNHRMGLYDMAMLKDNHIKAAGGIIPAVQQTRSKLPISIKIEVETTNLDEVRQAVEAGADIIMLDNMNCADMKAAVALINRRAKTEASGNITAARIREVAECGVDYVSVGALTHTVKALDISMNFIITPE